MKKAMNRKLFFLTVISLLVAGIAGCGSKAPVSENVVTAATATLSSPEDRCASANLPKEVAKVTRLMRSFDDVSVLAQATPKG